MTRRLRLPAILLLLVVAACGRPEVGPRMQRALGEAREWTASLEAAAAGRAPESLPAGSVIALAYLERARLGLGSPFRLAHYASVDPRLPPPVRRHVVHALLALTVDGAVHAPDWRALDSLTLPGRGDPLPGAVHGALLERAMRIDRDPRAGELAVRIAYRLAIAEGVVRPTALLPVARAAALLRDGQLARRDALALLRAAERGDEEIVPLLRTWRATRRLTVEQPALGPLTPAAEVKAIAEAERLLAVLRELPADSLASARLLAVTRAPRASFLPPPVAGRLATFRSVRSAPLQAPVRVAVQGHRRFLLEEEGRSPHERAARERFVQLATAEESFVAEYARLGAAGGRGPARVALWTALSLRPYAQEEPWFPGSGGPSVGELRSRFGLASVSFDAELPIEWRPYYTRMLASALNDLERIFPSFSAGGVGVHIGAQPLDAPALAVHEPRTRTVYLPPGSGAGAIAHELAHDLDWQLAAKTAKRRGQYLTDLSVRERRGELAERLRDLTTATLAAPSDPAPRARIPARPTEVFARSVDWYVAAALARAGRLNGYLTAVQDELFAGYASSLPPDASGEAAEAMIGTLDGMVTLPAETRRWFIGNYGRTRALAAYDVVRYGIEQWQRVEDREAAAERRRRRGLEFTTGDRAVQRLAVPLPVAPPPALGRTVDDDLTSPTCRELGSLAQRALAGSRARLVRLTAESIARGELAEQAGLASPAVELAGTPLAAWGPRPVEELARAADDVLAALTDSVLARLRAPAGDRPFVPPPPLVAPGC